MFWFVYILCSCVVSYLIGCFFKGKTKNLIIFTSLIVLLTPAQIVTGSNDYTPAMFTFVFNSILEQNYSLRVLRPIFLSLPLGYMLLGVFILIRRKFF